MKPIVNCRLRLLGLLVVIASLINGVVGTLTAKPKNVVGLIDEQLQLECASDTTPNNIQWLYASVVVSNTITPCRAADSRFTTAYNNGIQCYLNVQGNATDRLSGPYACDETTPGITGGQAIVIIIDPTPTSEVTTTGQIVQGQNVTLSCKMDYYYKTPIARLQPGAVVTASISWETAAGTFISNSSTELTNDNGYLVGESLQTHVWMTVTGTEIPSYKCTTLFQFSAADDADYTYAINSLTYTSTSDVTPVWHCPTSVNITPSTSAVFMVGDQLGCMSNGHPVNLSWIDTTGAFVATGNTTTVPAGDFHYFCAAVGTAGVSTGSPCIASANISGFGLGCPTDLTFSPPPQPQVMVGWTLTCSSTGGYPPPTYYILNGTEVVSWNESIAITGEALFNLTCVAISAYNGINCTNSTTVFVNATNEEVILPTTVAPFTGSTSNDTMITDEPTNTFTLLTIIFSILDACALFWLIGMCCVWPELTDPRIRRRKVRRIRKNYRSYNF